jgi:hypothetical protein
MTIKGLNLTPVQAATIVYGLDSNILQLGTSRYRGPLVIRANKTLPVDGQVLFDIGYKVEHRDAGVFLVKLPEATGIPGPRLIELKPGHIVGSADLADVNVSFQTYHEWFFTNAKPTSRRCPFCRGERPRCRVCNGTNKTDAIDMGKPVRRAWFQWDPK